MSLFSRLFGSSKKQEPTPDPRAVLAEGEEWASPVEWYIDNDGKSFRRKKKKCCGGGCRVKEDIGVAEVVSAPVEDIVMTAVVMNSSVTEDPVPSYISPEPASNYDPPVPSPSSYDSGSSSGSSSSYDSGSSSSYDSGSSSSCDSGGSCGGSD
jgi:hypothetical protein